MSAIPADIESPDLTIGSAEHRRALARFFIDTHIEFEATKIRWPVLSTPELERLSAYDPRLFRPRLIPGIARTL